MAESVKRHRGAVGARQRTENSMGSRWNDAVYQAIDRTILEQIVNQEQIYGNRLDELEFAHRRAHTRLEVIKSATY